MNILSHGHAKLVENKYQTVTSAGMDGKTTRSAFIILVCRAALRDKSKEQMVAVADLGFSKSFKKFCDHAHIQSKPAPFPVSFADSVTLFALCCETDCI